MTEQERDQAITSLLDRVNELAQIVNSFDSRLKVVEANAEAHKKDTESMFNATVEKPNF